MIWNIVKCFLTMVALTMMSGLGGLWSLLATAIVVAAVYKLVSEK